jgi:hypothetical protein
MVTHRYERPPHNAYAHLQEDPRAAQGDSLEAIAFATPSIAMVTLRIGHPPTLWTDYLTVAKLHNNRWWIVHKSSCSEPFLVDLKEEN